MDSKQIYALLQPLGLKPLKKSWAKIEIFLGLTFVFLGILFVIPAGPTQYQNLPFGYKPCYWDNGLAFLVGLAFFVLGGYLAMAGHRSHLYQSNNLLTAFLIEEIRKSKEKETNS